MEWNAIAYVHMGWTRGSKELNTVYKCYQTVLEKVNLLSDIPHFKYRYGSDYYFKHFFSDFNGEKNNFEEMLFTLENEDIDKVFMMCLLSRFNNSELGVLSKICKEKNIELMFPVDSKDNIAHSNFFDMYIELVS